MSLPQRRTGSRILGEAEFNANAFAVARDRQRKYGDVVIPERCVCQACGNKRPLQEMARIPSTRVIANVQDCVCIKCAQADHKEFTKVARIVCIGCKEVVAMVEPFKERTGFQWTAGGFYHVVECPNCSKQFAMKQSHILEKICFYKKSGIPYE